VLVVLSATSLIPDGAFRYHPAGLVLDDILGVQNLSIYAIADHLRAESMDMKSHH